MGGGQNLKGELEGPARQLSDTFNFGPSLAAPLTAPTDPSNDPGCASAPAAMMLRPHQHRCAAGWRRWPQRAIAWAGTRRPILWERGAAHADWEHGAALCTHPPPPLAHSPTRSTAWRAPHAYGTCMPPRDGPMQAGRPTRAGAAVGGRAAAAAAAAAAPPSGTERAGRRRRREEAGRARQSPRRPWPRSGQALPLPAALLLLLPHLLLITPRQGRPP
jgi:hypothetical protein